MKIITLLICMSFSFQVYSDGIFDIGGKIGDFLRKIKRARASKNNNVRVEKKLSKRKCYKKLKKAQRKNDYPYMQSFITFLDPINKSILRGRHSEDLSSFINKSYIGTSSSFFARAISKSPDLAVHFVSNCSDYINLRYSKVAISKMQYPVFDSSGRVIQIKEMSKNCRTSAFYILDVMYETFFCPGDRSGFIKF